MGWDKVLASCPSLVNVVKSCRRRNDKHNNKIKERTMTKEELLRDPEKIKILLGVNRFSVRCKKLC